MTSCCNYPIVVNLDQAVFMQPCTTDLCKMQVQLTFRENQNPAKLKTANDAAQLAFCGEHVGARTGAQADILTVTHTECFKP